VSSTPAARAVLADLLPWSAVDVVEVGRQDRRCTLLTMLSVTPAAGGPVQRLVLEQYRPGDDEGTAPHAPDRHLAAVLLAWKLGAGPVLSITHKDQTERVHHETEEQWN